MQSQRATIYTIGHSNRSLDALIDELLGAHIELVADIRRYPASRRNPQFNRDTLATALSQHGIAYHHFVELGGRRTPEADSTNMALRDPGFRGFADYMGTSDFDVALDDLLTIAAKKRTAIMCAESVPWRCHRSLLSDALLARGVEVRHLIGGKEREHSLSPIARVEGDTVRYPALF
jgi:uncharacterized protein (DUF488 family)